MLHPEKWNTLGRKGKKFLLSGIWILSGVLSFHALVEHTFSLDKKGWLQCKQYYLNDFDKVATLIWDLITFLVSILIVTFFYFHLY